jgi:hypothetical protein
MTSSGLGLAGGSSVQSRPPSSESAVSRKLDRLFRLSQQTCLLGGFR